MAGGAGPRRARGRRLRVRGRFDRHLLPRLVPEPEAAARSGHVLRVGGRRRQSGFRPCKRCRPDAIPVDAWAEKIRRACVYLANAEGHPSLAALAARIGGSPYHLQRNFKRLVGLTPRQYAEACRLRQGQAPAARRRRGHRRDARGGVRIEQPVLRTRRAEARHAAGGLSAGRSGNEHSIHHRRLRGSAGCSWRRPNEASARSPWARRIAS